MKGDKMNRSIKFDSSKNPALNFGIIVKDLEKIAKKSKIPMSEIISDFMIDLQNYYNEDYEKKVEDVTLKGQVSPNLLNSFNIYLNKILKLYKDKEKRDISAAKKADQEIYLEEKWSEIEKSIDGNIMDPRVMEKVLDDLENSDLTRKEKNFMKIKLDEKRKKFNETWESIENMVEKLSQENEGKTKPEYWQAIKDLISQRNQGLNIKMDEEMEKQMLTMIDQKISDEKDNMYYEQVKAFTNNFSFLKDYSEVHQAINGVRRIKFTDIESFNRFYDLRISLQNGYGNEFTQIERLLRREDISDIDKKILTARKEVINKEKEAKMELEAK